MNAGGQRRSRPTRVCCGCAFGVPLISALILAAIFRINNQPPDLVIPAHPMPADNAYDYFLRAEKLARKIKHKAPEKFNGDQHRLFLACQACAQEAGPALAELRAGLLRPCMAPRMRDFDPMAGFWQLARTVSGVSRYYELNHEPGKADETLLDLAEMAVMADRGGALLQVLMTLPTKDEAFLRFELLLARLSRDQLRHVAARLDRIAAKQVPYSDTLEEESYADTIDWLAQLRQAGSIKDMYEKAVRVVGVQGSLPTAGEGVKIARFMLGNKSRMIKENQEYVHKVALEARKPYTGHISAQAPHNILAERRGEVLLGVWQAVVEHEAMVAVLRGEVALLRYHAANGRYPTGLPDLIPAYLKSVPDDPCAGADGVPLRYKQLDGGRSYLLYSVGSDLIDNGGRPLWASHGRGGDIVAGKLWRYKETVK